MKYCPNCGKKVSAEANFCESCGIKLTPSQSPTAPVNFQSEKTNETNTGKFYQKERFIWGMLVLFFPVGVFLLWKYMNYHTNTKLVITGAFLSIIYKFFIN